jgi:preprotein translocase SecF subunit
MRFPERPYLNIVGHKYIWFGISAAIFVVSVVALVTQGLNFGIDFTGGTEITIKTANGASIEKVRSVTADFGYEDAQIQSSVQNTYIVKVPELSDEQSTALVKALDEKIGLEKDSKGEVVADIKNVGPGWGARVSRQAMIALAVFILAVLIYISFRFEFKMAVTAIIELLHDFVITIGVYALLGFEVTPATIIAVLTILGYSLYDAIVIFDRVKENTDQLTRQSKKTYSETVNDSVNQVLMRSINTSLTTLIPIVCIIFFGGETLKAFAIPLFLGVFAGTYSSIILAPPILSMWKETEPKYKAYRDRAERGAAKTKAAGKTAAPAAVQPTPAAKKAPPGKKPQARAAQPQKKAAQAPKPKPAPARPKAAGAAEGTEQAGPRPKPKPKPPAGKAAQPTSKSLAKSRTKGPGSGKKKKKKR